MGFLYTIEEISIEVEDYITQAKQCYKGYIILANFRLHSISAYFGKYTFEGGHELYFKVSFFVPGN